MATELIASGASQSSKVDYTVTAGTPVSLFIYYTGSSSDVRYKRYRKSSAGAYQYLDTLTPENIALQGVIEAGGVYAVERQAGANASSIEKD